MAAREVIALVLSNYSRNTILQKNLFSASSLYHQLYFNPQNQACQEEWVKIATMYYIII
jgi:hypothetical protein